MSAAGKVVCVTGASGYIASWLVKLLLERGYTVKASVRDLNDPRKTEFLMALDGAKERLQLFQANLLEEGSFDAIVDGCEGVFHAASPVPLSVSNPQLQVLEVSSVKESEYSSFSAAIYGCYRQNVKGTLNVLQSCAKVQSIKRVILTSSIAAVIYNDELKDGVIVDESWFSVPLYCEEHKLWYQLSKILAENAAWDFSKEHGIDMIAINPGMVTGPFLQPSATLSAEVILSLVNGIDPFPNMVIPWVDVRDVAYSHIVAFEIASASGRYCVVERTAGCCELIRILTELFPTLQLPDKCSNGSPLIQLKYDVSNEKVKGLGIEFMPLEVSLKDTIESFKEMKLVSL